MSDFWPQEELSESDEILLDQYEVQCRADLRLVEKFIESMGRQVQPMLLLELTLLEMEFRYKAGDFVRAEEYFARFPLLANSPELMVRLITEEFRLRQAQFGPKFDDYLLRFPRLRMPLLAAMHDMSGSFGSTRRQSPLPTSEPQWLGHYEIIEQIGQGSFGTVYKAKDQLLGRIVAVKKLRAGEEHNFGFSAVLNEAKNAAILTHPHIVPLYEVTITDNHECLIVGQFIDGSDLAEMIRRSSISCRQSAAWMLAIAQALHSAHSLGILHLDIKPSNILLDSQCKVWLSDFGLSRCRQEIRSQAGDVATAGTLAYMSPEHAGVQRNPIDERSDVYSLGVVLFELLTGRLPFQGNRQSLLEQLCSAEPPEPRQLRKEIHRDLEQICLKALSRSPEQRYQSAKAMADDLERYLAGKPTHARPLGIPAKAVRWCQSNPLLTSFAALFVFACFAGTAGIVQQWQRALQQEQLAENSAATLFNSLATMVQLSSQNALRDPNSRDQMQSMLIVAKENYEQALKSNPVTLSKPYQTALALHGLGTVFNQLGDYDRAIQVFDEAEHCLSGCISISSYESLTTEITLGKATSYRRSGKKQLALPLYYRALGNVIHAVSTECDCLKRTAEIAWYIAEAELSSRNFETASTMASMSLEQWSACQKKFFPNGDYECITGTAKSNYLMATCHYELRRFDQAAEGFAQASKDFEKLSQQYPEAINYRRDLAASYHNQARALHELGDDESSEQSYCKAIEIRRDLVVSSPDNTLFVGELKGSEANLNKLRHRL